MVISNERQARIRASAEKRIQLFLVEIEHPVVRGIGPNVREKDLRRHGLYNGLASTGPFKLARILGHHHSHGVLFPCCHQPLRQAFSEILVVECLPRFINDDDGWAAVFDLPLDPAEQVAKNGHPFLVAFAVEDPGQVEADQIAVQ